MSGVQYVVDGEWLTNHAEPIEYDHSGNANNVLHGTHADIPDPPPECSRMQMLTPKFAVPAMAAVLAPLAATPETVVIPIATTSATESALPVPESIGTVGGHVAESPAATTTTGSTSTTATGSSKPLTEQATETAQQVQARAADLASQAQAKAQEVAPQVQAQASDLAAKAKENAFPIGEPPRATSPDPLRSFQCSPYLSYSCYRGRCCPRRCRRRRRRSRFAHQLGCQGARDSSRPVRCDRLDWRCRYA